MRLLRTRNDLLSLISPHAPTSACARAISEGRAIVLGGFNSPQGFYFLAEVPRAGHQTPRIFKALYNESKGDYKVSVEHDNRGIAWHEWAGRETNPVFDLIDGDHPEVSARLYERAIAAKNYDAARSA